MSYLSQRRSARVDRHRCSHLKSSELSLSSSSPLKTWQRYMTLLTASSSYSMQSYVPQLFLSLVQEWGISQDLMIRTITKEELQKWLEKGISNVAFLSLGLGLDNKAASAFIQAKVRTTSFSLPSFLPSFLPPFLPSFLPPFLPSFLPFFLSPSLLFLSSNYYRRTYTHRL